jgi:hypothetical protein
LQKAQESGRGDVHGHESWNQNWRGVTFHFLIIETPIQKNYGHLAFIPLFFWSVSKHVVMCLEFPFNFRRFPVSRESFSGFSRSQGKYQVLWLAV